MNLPDLYCVRCSLQFDKESDLKKHVVSKNHMKEHFEPIHEKKKLFKERVQIKEEPKSSENETNLVLEKVLYRCGICDSILETKIILDQHYNASYHETLFTCEKCEYSFSQKGNLKLHVESVQEGKKPTKNDGEKHIDSVHEKKRPFKCEICNKHFLKRNHMTEHVRFIHEKKNLFKCDICDYGSSRKGDWKKHVAAKHPMKENVEPIHEKKKLFKCGISDYGSSSDLKKHVVSVHEEQKHVISAHEEKKHVVSAHEEKKPVVSAHEKKKHAVSDHEEKKALKCKKCLFICSTKYFMKKHVDSVHENKKPIEM